ncbi:MAG: cell division protein FtsW, partial [Bermanella sp.]
MSSATRVTATVPVWQQFDFKQSIILDRRLLWAVIILASIGWLMVTSASMDWAERQFGNNLYISLRHGIYLALGALTAFVTMYVPLAWVRKMSGVLILLSLVSLLMVVIPGIGR